MARSPGSFDARRAALPAFGKRRCFQKRSVLPETVARDPRPFGERRKLEPGDLRIAAGPADKRAEAAVGAADHVLLADNVGEALEALRDQTWVLDVVGQRVDDAG